MKTNFCSVTEKMETRDYTGYFDTVLNGVAATEYKRGYRDASTLVREIISGNILEEGGFDRQSILDALIENF